MRFDGQWLECDDGIVRPVMRAEILAGNGLWRSVELLVDTGADRTVISANVLEALNLNTTEPQDRIGGVGGLVDSVDIRAEIRLMRDDGQTAIFRGDYAACTDHEALDMTVLGRDLLEMFAVIADRHADTLAIIGGQHRYTISIVGSAS